MANEVRATHEYRPNPNFNLDAVMRAVQEKLSDELKTEAQTMADLPYTAKLGEDEIVLLIQLLNQHTITVQNDPSKAHLLSEGNPQTADGDFTSKLLRKLLAVRRQELSAAD
jgi:hypothetical protein